MACGWHTVGSGCHVLSYELHRAQVQRFCLCSELCCRARCLLQSSARLCLFMRDPKGVTNAIFLSAFSIFPEGLGHSRRRRSLNGGCRRSLCRARRLSIFIALAMAWPARKGKSKTLARTGAKKHKKWATPQQRQSPCWEFGIFQFKRKKKKRAARASRAQREPK